MAETTTGGARATGRHTTANDIQLEKVRLTARAWVVAIHWLGGAICLGASTFPLKFIYFAVRELAGKDTKLSIGITITLSVVGVAAAAKLWLDRKKMAEQSKEILRLRERCAALEAVQRNRA